MIKLPDWLALIFQKKMLLILALGFASGLPLGLTATTLQAWYAIDGVSIITIGFLGLVGQPYVYKFIWAPLVDKWHPPYLGLRRSWMLSTQLGLITVLCGMALLNPTDYPYLLGFLALCLAILSATQDIVIDAYRVELLLPEERGLGTAMTTAGYRLAMIVSASLTLIIAHHVGFSTTYFMMAGLMGVGIIATLWGKEPHHERITRPDFLNACIEPFKEFLNRKNAIALLVFIVLYKLGDAFANSLSTAFLLKHVGFSLKEIGYIYKTGGLVSTLLGVFVGGICMIRIGLFRSLLWFGMIQALTNLLFYALSILGKHYGMFILTVCLENFGSGLGTAAFMALVMALCNPQFTATQFALLTALAAVGRVFVGPAAGYLVNYIGWSEFFIWTVIFAIPGLVLLCWLRPTIYLYEGKPQEEVFNHAESSAEEMGLLKR